ncbi:MAG TPA: hypothetical protein PLN48_11980 [Lachnospiraceae bacterium]|nr:hypothetical protein [Lachnospiraceae bacterium]
MAEFISNYWILILIAAVCACLWLLVNVYGKHLQQVAAKEQARPKDVPVAAVKNGTKVILDSGIHGVIRSSGTKTFMVEIARGVCIEVEKYGVVFVQDDAAEEKSRILPEQKTAKAV